MKQDYPEVFNRLDQAYAWWEEEMWMAWVLRWWRLQFPDLASRFEPLEGYPFDGFSETKQLLMRSVSEEDLSFLWPMCMPERIRRLPVKPEVSSEEESEKRRLTVDTQCAAYWDHFYFPYFLGRWSQSSRRMYYVSDDLALQLRATSLSGVKWGDIKPPFDAFCVALESPITAFGNELDFFLFGDYFKSFFAMYALKHTLAQWKPMEPALRAKVTAAVYKNNKKRVGSLFEKEIRKWTVGEQWNATVGHRFSTEENLDEDCERLLMKEMKSLSEDERGEGARVMQIFRLLIGLCLYFQSFGEHDKRVVERVSVQPRLKPEVRRGEALLQSSEVCKVQSIISLSDEEKEGMRLQLSGRGGWEVKTHFRQGHWKRPKGEGHNPAAQKTVWVRPTLVRRDRLPENALPLGVGEVFP